MTECSGFELEEIIIYLGEKSQIYKLRVADYMVQGAG